MERNLIQQYLTGIVNALKEQAESLAPLTHAGTKGTLRELFVSAILKRFLVSHIGVGSGVIINPNGGMSGQTDIILYDKRLLSPFIQQDGIGVFPIESVIDTIEVKSWLGPKEIREADERAKQLTAIFALRMSHTLGIPLTPPGTAVFGFKPQTFGPNDISVLESEQDGREWLTSNVSAVKQICVLGTLSWLCVQQKWNLQLPTEHREETKRFIAVFMDNVRSHAEKNYRLLEGHYDWMSSYMRDR